MAVFPIEDDICEKKASDFLWETLYFTYYPSVEVWYIRVVYRVGNVVDGLAVNLTQE